MSIKSQFQEQMYKEDLLAVIKQVIFMSLMGGLLIGALQLLMIYQFGFDLTWLMLFVLAMLTARRIKRVVYKQHIVFNILSVVAFILAFYFMNVTVNVGIYYLLTGNLHFEVFRLALDPIPFFIFLYPLNPQFFGVNNILEVVFFLIGIYYAFQRSK